MAEATAEETQPQAEQATYPMTAETFERSHLYMVTSDGRQLNELVESWEEYTALWDGGWRSSLAAFGVETMPGGLRTVMNAPPPPPPQVSTDTYRQVLDLLVSHQTQQDMLEGRVDALEDQPASGASARQLDALTARVDALERTVKTLMEAAPGSTGTGRSGRSS